MLEATRIMLLYLTIAAVFAITPEEQFQDFISTYGKRYDSEEEFTKRFGIFRDNLLRVEKQNEEHIKLYDGEAVFGVTKFSDLTPTEFKAMYLRAKANNIPDEKRVVPEFDGPLADEVDWVAKGACTPVKDQGQCGSCWAFSAVEAVESYGFLNHKYNLTKLSTQQVNSCDKVDLGCNGGNTESAYDYIRKNGGLTSFANYPYTSGTTSRTGMCKKDKAKDVVESITGYKSVAKGESNLKTALNSGPVSICVAAAAFQTYTHGILKLCPGQIDHCVQAVGYSTSGDYWRVKNSWATSWGEKGFIRLKMGKNICKISDDVTYPTF